MNVRVLHRACSAFAEWVDRIKAGSKLPGECTAARSFFAGPITSRSDLRKRLVSASIQQQKNGKYVLEKAGFSCNINAPLWNCRALMRIRCVGECVFAIVNLATAPWCAGLGDVNVGRCRV